MSNRMLYDAFPTRNGADAAVSALRARGCAGATSKRLAKAQDGGRLKFGVYTPSRCLAMGLAATGRRKRTPRSHLHPALRPGYVTPNVAYAAFRDIEYGAAPYSKRRRRSRGRR